MALYENQTIGQFLALLGYKMGKDKLDMQCSINLLQQTKLDSGLADVQVGPKNRYVMVEFKRDDSNSSEKNKKGLRRSVNRRIENLKMLSPVKYAGLRDISVRAHWAALGKSGVGISAPDACFTALLNFMVPGLEWAYRLDLHKNYSTMGAFIDDLFDPDDDFIGVDQLEFKSYLDYLFEDADKAVAAEAIADAAAAQAKAAALGVLPLAPGPAPQGLQSAAAADWLIMKVSPQGVTWTLTTVGEYLSPSVKKQGP